MNSPNPPFETVSSPHRRRPSMGPLQSPPTAGISGSEVLAGLGADELLESMPDGVILLDGHGTVVYANAMAEVVLHRPRHRLIGMAFGTPDLIQGGREISVRSLHGQRLVIRVAAKETPEHFGFRYVVTLRDETSRARDRDELAHKLLLDELTGLYNRRGLMVLGEQQLRLAERLQRSVAVLMLDLDGFKAINDTLGHAAGDAALVEAAQILTSSFRRSDIVARYGGDEFVVIASGAREKYLQRLLSRANERLNHRNAASELPYRLSMTIGETFFFNGREATLDQLIEEADRRMYSRKRGVEGRIGLGGRLVVNTDPEPA